MVWSAIRRFFPTLPRQRARVVLPHPIGETQIEYGVGSCYLPLARKRAVVFLTTRTTRRNLARIGTIIETKGPLATVRSGRRGICEGCSQEADCCGPDDPGQEILSIRNSLAARVGERVEFDLPGHGELLLAVLVWAVPLVGLLAGAIVGRAMAPEGLTPDTSGLLAGVVGFLIGLLPAIVIDRRARRSGSYLPETVRKVGYCTLPTVSSSSQVVKSDTKAS